MRCGPASARSLLSNKPAICHGHCWRPASCMAFAAAVCFLSACVPVHSVRNVEATCSAPVSCQTNRDSCIGNVRSCGLVSKDQNQELQCEVSYRDCLAAVPNCAITQEPELGVSAARIVWDILVFPLALLVAIGTGGLALEAVVPCSL